MQSQPNSNPYSQKAALSNLKKLPKLHHGMAWPLAQSPPQQRPSPEKRGPVARSCVSSRGARPPQATTPASLVKHFSKCGPQTPGLPWDTCRGPWVQNIFIITLRHHLSFSVCWHLPDGAQAAMGKTVDPPHEPKKHHPVKLTLILF